MSTCFAFRTDPRSARWRAGVPRMPLRGVPSILELGVPYISGELASISLCMTETHPRCEFNLKDHFNELYTFIKTADGYRSEEPRDWRTETHHWRPGSGCPWLETWAWAAALWTCHGIESVVTVGREGPRSPLTTQKHQNESGNQNKRIGVHLK